MNVFFVILFAALLLSVPVLIYWYLVRVMPKMPCKLWITVVLGVLLLVGEFLFVSVAALPVRYSRVVNQATERVENYMNQISPDFTKEVITMDRMKALIVGNKQIHAFVREDKNVNCMLRWVGVNDYLDLWDEFDADSGGYAYELQDANKDFTLHNVFAQMHKRAKMEVMSTVRVLEIMALVLLGLCYIAVLVWIVRVRPAVPKKIEKTN